MANLPLDIIPTPSERIRYLPSGSYLNPSPAPFRFLELPQELRDRVYDALFLSYDDIIIYDEEHGRLRYTQKWSSTGHAIHLVNHQVMRETMFLPLRLYALNFDIFCPNPVTSFCGFMVRLCMREARMNAISNIAHVRLHASIAFTRRYSFEAPTLDPRDLVLNRRPDGNPGILMVLSQRLKLEVSITITVACDYYYLGQSVEEVSLRENRRGERLRLEYQWRLFGEWVEGRKNDAPAMGGVVPGWYQRLKLVVDRPAWLDDDMFVKVQEEDWAEVLKRYLISTT